MNIDKIYFFVFSFFLILTISSMVAMVKKKEYKSPKFILYALATIIFLVNIYLRIDRVF